MSRTKPLRIAVLVAEDAEKWRGYTERGWCDVMKVGPDDTIEYFMCYESKWPLPSEVDDKFDVVIVGGSHYSAYEDIPWIHALASTLREYVNTTKKARIIACCFGHQLLAKAMGGSIGRYSIL